MSSLISITQKKAGILLFSLATGAGFNAHAAVVDDFESWNLGATASGDTGTASGSLFTQQSGSATGAIVASPFVNGGDQAWEFLGATGSNYSRLYNDPSDAIENKFSLSFDYQHLDSAATPSAGTRFLTLRGNDANGNNVDVAFLNLRMSTNSGGYSWFVAANGSGTVTATADGAASPGAGPARLSFSQDYKMKVEVSSDDLSAGKYGVKIVREDGEIVFDRTALAFTNLNFVSIRGFVIGDVAGIGLNGRLDNISLVPEPGATSLLLAGSLMLGVRRRSQKGA